MILRVCVVIPCHDQQRTISEVVKGVIQQTRFPVLIVDDGSEYPVTHYLYSFEVKEALEHGRVRVVRSDSYGGRDQALRLAAHELIAGGYTHMLTFPADGSGTPSDINKLLEEGRKNPWAIILGCRKSSAMARQRAPSKASRKADLIWWKHVTTQVQDPLSPIKLYPLFALQRLVGHKRMGHWELTALQHLLWQGWGVREIAVQLEAIEDAEKLPWLRIVKERLSLMLFNGGAQLLTFSGRHTEVGGLCLAVFFGGFAGLVPSALFRFVLSLVLALVLPLNFMAVWLSALASAALSASLNLTEFEIGLGKKVFAIGYGDGLMGHAQRWLAGGVLTGFMVGFLLAFAVFVVAKPSLRSGLWGAAWTQQVLKKIARLLTPSACNALAHASVFFESLLNPERWLGLNEFYSLLDGKLSFQERQIEVYHHLWCQARRRIQSASDSKQIVPVQMQHSSGVLRLAVNLGDPVRGADARLDRVNLRNCELVPFLGGLAPFDPSGFDRAARNGQDVSLTCILPGNKGERPSLDLMSLKGLRYSPNVSLEIQRLSWLSHTVSRLEGSVRKHPREWMNLYRFWSKPPEGESGPGLILENLYEERSSVSASFKGGPELPML